MAGSTSRAGGWLDSWAALVGVFRDHGADQYASLAASFAAEPPMTAPHAPLIVLHAVRWAALQGRAADPWTADPDTVRADLTRLRPEIDVALARGLVQFTDPQRMTDLLPGLLLAASRYPGRPLRLVEIGACAGLLLTPERYAIAYPRARWAPPEATTDLSSPLDVPPELLDQPLEIVGRVGIDLAPVDSATGYDYLRSFTWPGDDDRERRLRSALAAAAVDPVPMITGDVLDALPDVLSQGIDVVTVIVESAVTHYLEQRSALRLGRVLDEAAGRGPLVLVSRSAGPPGDHGLGSVVTVSDLTGRWRSAYAASDGLSERAVWTGPDFPRQPGHTLS